MTTTTKKWIFPLNEFGQPAPADLPLLMIAESWERGKFDTKHLEEQHRNMKLLMRRRSTEDGR